MEKINKWVCLISLGSMVCSLTAYDAFVYFFYHPFYVVHLLTMSLLSAVGQFVVYTLIKLFKQHIVPFIITIRKIMSVLFSILFYHHKTSIIQLTGIAIVIGAVTYEFAMEVKKDEEKKPIKNTAIEMKEE